MSARRVGVLLGKELVHGSKSFFFVFAVLVPLVLSLVLSLVFGNLFSETPSLGIADEGSSRLAQLAADQESFDLKTYASSDALNDAVRKGVVDIGIVLPAGFDEALADGSAAEVTAYVWGESLAKNRIIAEPLDVASRNPDIFLGSWCGRKFRPEHVFNREGWENVPAVVNRQVFEIKSANILQPGPAALTDGLDQLRDIIHNWAQQHG